MCSKDSSKNIDDQFDELKQQYLNGEGTNHKEVVKINDSELDIKVWLDNIRHKEIENFVIFAMYNEKPQTIFSKTGDQFSSPEIDLIDIYIKKLVPLIVGGVKNIDLYVVHNHPFIYKALPSSADLKTLEILVEAFNMVEREAKSINKSCQITLIDFAIVTEFDTGLANNRYSNFI